MVKPLLKVLLHCSKTHFALRMDVSQILFASSSVGIRDGCIYDKPPNSHPTCKAFILMHINEV